VWSGGKRNRNADLCALALHYNVAEYRSLIG
jgi:hypothetical protein